MNTTSIKPLTFFVALVALLLGACNAAEGVRPASNAFTFNNNSDRAVTHDFDINLAVDTNAWMYHPRNLNDEFIPLQVTVQNNNGFPLLLRYSSFRIQRLDEPEVLRAVSPLAIDKDLPHIVDESTGDQDAFLVHDELQGHYVTKETSSAQPIIASPDDSYYHLYFDPYYGHDPSHREVALPTRDMLMRAMPEGVLNTGERAEGFIYLEELEDEDARLVFEFDVVNASTGELVGQLTIPLRGRH